MQGNLLSSPSQRFEAYDELDIKNKPEYRNLLEVEERVLFSGTLVKINKRADAQQRILVITNKHIYNIQPESNILTKVSFFINPRTSIKRKIPISKVWGFTISSQHLSEQFVLHIDSDYDYRYEARGTKEKVLRSLCQAYFKINKHFPLYIREEKDLTPFQTTDDDFKLGIDKKPREGKIYITQETLDKGLVWIITNRYDLIKDTLNMKGSAYEINRGSTILAASNASVIQSQTSIARPSYQQQGSIPVLYESSYTQAPIKQNENTIDFRQPAPSVYTQSQVPMNGGVGQDYQFQLNQQGGSYQQQYYPNGGLNEQRDNSNNNFEAPSSYDPIKDLIKADWAPINTNVNVHFGDSFSFDGKPGAEKSNDYYLSDEERARKHFPK